MAQIEIADFQISAAAESKVWSHGINQDKVYAVLDHYWTTRAQRAARYLLIGRDHQGRCLTIPIVATEDPLIWRPITAWYCKPSEAARLR